MTERDMLAYLAGEDDETLFTLADAARHAVHGQDVFIRSIVEFSNYCNKKCRYCGLRAPNAGAVRYRLSPGEIVRAACRGADAGAGTIVLQSGDDFHYDAEMLGTLIRAIRDLRENVAVTLSVGDRSLREYAYWRRCGADRVLIKIETSDPARYKTIREGELFEDRLSRFNGLRDLGYEVGTGVIAGLPGATLDDALRDVLLLTSLDPDMIAVGPFVPNPDTPLGQEPPGDPLLSLRMTALLRLLNPMAHIPATSALDALMDGGRERGLRCGCNVLMPSMTPDDHRRDYAIYPGKNRRDLDVTDSLDRAVAAIRRAGFTPTAARGGTARHA